MGKKYEKFTTIEDSVLRKYIFEMLKKDFTEGYYIKDLVKGSDGKWIIHFETRI